MKKSNDEHELYKKALDECPSLSAFIPKLGKESDLFKRPDRLLYHYTTAKGLLGILESKTIWMTNYNFLNDQTEYKHGFESVRKKAIEKCKSIQEGELSKITYSSLIHYLADYLNGKKELYLCCFSDFRDSIDQWRGYTDQNGSFALGFDFTDLYQKFDKINYGPRKIIYNDDIKNEIYDALFNQIDTYLSDAKYRNKYVASALAVKALGCMEFIFPSFKNESFQNEHEWRIWTYREDDQDRDVLFQNRGNEIFSYKELKIPDIRKRLKEIIIGPYSINSASEISLKLLKEKENYDFEIFESVVPLRT